MSFPTAIVAFLLLFATFAVGLRCFADFDRGLQASKVNGQFYKPVVTKMDVLNGNKLHDFLDIPTRPKYSQNVDSTGNMSQRQSSYNTQGAPLGPRISIE